MAAISIIMSVYNCEKTIQEAIDSILGQDFSDWELIICDDGSTDHTPEIIKTNQAKLQEKIIFIKNETNLGLNKSLNKCLERVSGEYVARMDGDDISLPERLNTEFNFLEEHPNFAVVSSAMIHFDESGDWGISRKEEIPELKSFVKNSPVHCHAPSLIRTQAIMSVGGYSESKKTMRFEDVDLWFRIYAAGFRGYNLQQPLYKMRDDQNAVIRRSIHSRMNSIYVMKHGFDLLKLPSRYYLYLPIDFLKHVVKALMPIKLYSFLHKKAQRSELTNDD